jgi:hypothetical protein
MSARAMRFARRAVRTRFVPAIAGLASVASMHDVEFAMLTDAQIRRLYLRDRPARAGAVR